MQRRMVRIQDIASEVGVSPATVSLVLNNKGNALRISPGVQAAVLEAAQRMGYRPNLSARRLRSSTPEGLILALLTAREASFSLLHSVFAGAQRYANESPVPLQITVESFAQGKLSALAGLTNGMRFNGAIIANSGPEDDAFVVSHDLPMPVILFARHTEGHSCVDATDYASGRMAAELLLKRGRRHLCLIRSGQPTQAREDRCRGFIDVAIASGYPPPLEATAPTFDEQGGYTAITTLLSSKQVFDGIFALFDYIAIGAICALRQAIARYVEPPLTTFHMPLVEMAYDAAASLVGILLGELKEPICHTFQTTLVERQSA